MLLTLVVILLLIGAAVVGSLYSGFLTFYSNFGETENYHKAYYASIAALERAELVIKQREPGFVGSGGRKDIGTSTTNKQSTGSYTNEGSIGGSDGLLTGFSYLSSDDDRSSNLFRSINSRATRIPATGQGNVDWMMSTGSSLDYNIMDYENAEIFLLYYDTSSGNPYSGASCNDWGCTKSSLEKITGEIRLPEKLKNINGFGNLNTNQSLTNNGVKNDAIVDRQLKGQYKQSQFTLYASQRTQEGNERKIAGNDTAIRESDINSGVSLNFNNSRRPFTRSSSTDAAVTIISSKENEITGATNNKFQSIFNGSDFTNLQLRLALLNLLRTSNTGTIYPYLEYYLDFGGKEVSDKYFNINAEGKFADFQVNLLFQKPTIKESILGSFTVIF